MMRSVSPVFCSIALGCCVALGVLTTLGDIAHAEDLIVESYVGDRPGEAAELLHPVIGALVEQGFASADASASIVDVKFSAPTTLLSEPEIEAATKFINSAFTQFQNGAFKSALRDARPGLDRLAKGPATLIRLPNVREVKLRGLIAAALAHSRLGNADEAHETTSEIIRSFADKPIDTTVYSPEVVKLVSDTKATLVAKGTANLTIETDVEGTVIYINELYAGVGRVQKSDLAPGEYRVILQSGERLGRVHRVRLAAGERRVLPLSWALDELLATEKGRVLLKFKSEAERASREGEFALALGREVGAKRVAVLGVREVEGQRRVIGTLYSATRKTPDGAWLAAEPTLPQREALKALGNYLGGDKSGVDLIEPLAVAALTTGTRSGTAAPAIDTGNGGSSTLGWIGVGLGVGAMAGGATLIAIHKDEFDSDRIRNPNPRNTRVPGIVTLGAGAVLTGVGIFLLLRGGDDSGSEETRTSLELSTTTGGMTVGLSGRF